MNLSKIVIIGLTGQSGAGKTTVTEVFNNDGFKIINADDVARQVMNPKSKCLDDVAALFGKEILCKDGSLYRQELARIVFNDKKKLINLNEIVYPYITDMVFEKVEYLAQEGCKSVILDAPTLFESGINKYCQKIISVVADKALRLSRIIIRDKITEKMAESRINSQHADNYYTERSDYVIKNNGLLSDLLTDARKISGKIKEQYGT